jgi:hypothetical protein
LRPRRWIFGTLATVLAAFALLNVVLAVRAWREHCHSGPREACIAVLDAKTLEPVHSNGWGYVAVAGVSAGLAAIAGLAAVGHRRDSYG